MKAHPMIKNNHELQNELIERMAVSGIFIHESADIPLSETTPDRPHRFKTPSDKGNNPNEWKGWIFVQRDANSIYGAFGSRDLTSNEGYGFKIYLEDKAGYQDEAFEDLTAGMSDEEYEVFMQEKAEAQKAREALTAQENEARLEQKRIAEAKAKEEREEIFRAINQEYLDAPNGLGHEYITRKDIPVVPEDVRRASLPLSFRKEKSTSADTLIVPVYNTEALLSKFEKRVTTFQLIRKVPIKQEDGSYKSDMKKGFPFAGKGIYLFGSPRDSKPIVITEGWATGEAIHRASGVCVVVAFSASAMVDTAKVVRKSNPKSLIIIAQDNDEAGKAFCNQAVAVSKGILVDAGNGKKGYDFSDLYLEKGIEAVKVIIDGAIGGQFEDVKALTVTEKNELEIIPASEFPLSYKPHIPVNPKSAGYISLHRLDRNATNVRPNGKLQDTLDAFEEVNGMCGIEYRQNEITGALEIILPNEHLYPSIQNRSLDDKSTIVKSAIEAFGGGIKEIPAKISAMCGHNVYNPITTWIKSKEWDGVDRFGQLMKALTFKNDHNRPVYEKVWLSQLIYAVATWTDTTGHKSNGCIILTGKGAAGKSTFISTLLPETLDGMDTYRSISMPSLDNKDSVLQASTCPLVEIPEIDKATRSEKRSRDGKAFLDQKENFVRKAYDRFETKIQRRSVIFGTANNDELLSDMTGNRKYIPMAVETCDIYHTTDMQQLYAQLLEVYVAPWIKAGRPRKTPWEFGRELIEALEALSQECIELPSSVLAFQDAFDLSVPVSQWNEFMNARTALIFAGIKEPNTQQSTELNTYMASIGATRKRKSTGSGWLFPPLKDQSAPKTPTPTTPNGNGTKRKYEPKEEEQDIVMERVDSFEERETVVFEAPKKGFTRMEEAPFDDSDSDYDSDAFFRSVVGDDYLKGLEERKRIARQAKGFENG